MEGKNRKRSKIPFKIEKDEKYLQCISYAIAKHSCTDSFLLCFFFLYTDVTFSFPYTANAVLEGAFERVIVGDLFCDIPLGLYVIRGENVVLLGELV